MSSTLANALLVLGFLLVGAFFAGSEIALVALREGQVRNDVSIVAAGVVELREEKPRYSATFLNRFDGVGEGTRYAIEAEVRLRWPWALLAPLLRPVVNRALRRLTLEPVRRAAEQRGDTMRRGSV